MKIVGYVALHYGSCYLGWAIRSIIDHVDELWILYAVEGSHGHRTDHRNPDTRQQLVQIAKDAAGDKLRWYDGSWPYEGAQRETIHYLAPDADAVIALDADEIWPDYDFRSRIMSMAENDFVGQRVRLPMIHFWRSFHRAVLHDPAFPERIIFPSRHSANTGTIHPERDGKWLKICHMGYAQRSEIVEYKQHTHGHKAEWRRDCDWFRDKFMANSQEDCHPVGSEYWNPEQVNPWDYMPAFMKDHPYANLEVIP